MIIKLDEIVETPGGVIPFDFDFDLSDLELNYSFPMQEPVRFVGEIRNTAGILTLSADCETVLEFDCARCAEHTRQSYFLPVEATLAESLADPDDIDNADILMIDENCSIDLEYVLRETLLLECDMVFLCSEDCKGLCPKCGKNLNEGACDCGRDVDPRLAKLLEYHPEN